MKFQKVICDAPLIEYASDIEFTHQTFRIRRKGKKKVETHIFVAPPRFGERPIKFVVTHLKKGDEIYPAMKMTKNKASEISGLKYHDLYWD